LGFGHVEDARILTQSQGASPDSWQEVRQRLPLLSDEQWYRRVQRGYAPGESAVAYVDNVRRYYEILMCSSCEAPTTAQELLTAANPTTG
jgi:membrane-bound lytic murein transglycosylase F